MLLEQDFEKEIKSRKAGEDLEPPVPGKTSLCP
jgi:hypothetical protein